MSQKKAKKIRKLYRQDVKKLLGSEAYKIMKRAIRRKTIWKILAILSLVGNLSLLYLWRYHWS